MADTPANALLALVPADGTQIGNQKLREQLAAQGHVLDEDGYNELRDQLVAAGKLAKGRGRGGAVKLPGAGQAGASATKPAPAPKKPQGGKARNGTAHLGFEEQLWQAADKLRGHMDASEYKGTVLGLIFLKYISDSFEAIHSKLSEDEYADPEDRDEYVAERVFWVPKEARWVTIQAKAKDVKIGEVIDDAFRAIERENPRLKGHMPKDYARPALDKHRLGELVDLIAGIGFGGEAQQGQDVLGRVYEYFLGKFAAAEGKLGGEFFTASCVVRLIVAMVEPFKGRVYDPCCGSGGFFVQSEAFVESYGGRIGDISVYGQESNPTTWKLASMNLAIRGIEGNLGQHHADTFHRDLHPDLRADYVLANPPFNISDWGGNRLREDARWKYGAPPVGNANFGWVQHMVSKLAPKGVAGFVLANGSMSSQQSGEGEIRRRLIEDRLVDCMVALPGQLFYTTQIPVCLWFLRKGRPADSGTLFIDCRKLGTLVDRVHRELSEEEIARIAETYHAWRSGTDYADIPGFCKAATGEEIASHNFVLTPGRYVGAEEQEADDEPFAEKMVRLSARLREQFAEGRRLEAAIEGHLVRLGL
jgi:type I restriction enzyme M protein